MIGSFPRGFPSFCVTPETRRGKHLPESNANHSNSFHQSLHREGIAHGIRVITYRTTSRTAFVAGNRSTFGTFLQVIHYSPAVRTSSITNKLFFLSLIFWFLVSHLRLLSEGIFLILFLSETRRGDLSPNQTRIIRIIRHWQSRRGSRSPRSARSGGKAVPCPV